MTGDLDEVRVGPHPFWLWAIHPGTPSIAGIGYFTKRGALNARRELAASLPELPTPGLLKRTGLLSVREVLAVGERVEADGRP